MGPLHWGPGPLNTVARPEHGSIPCRRWFVRGRLVPNTTPHPGTTHLVSGCPESFPRGPGRSRPSGHHARCMHKLLPPTPVAARFLGLRVTFQGAPARASCAARGEAEGPEGWGRGRRHHLPAPGGDAALCVQSLQGLAAPSTLRRLTARSIVWVSRTCTETPDSGSASGWVIPAHV